MICRLHSQTCVFYLQCLPYVSWRNAINRRQKFEKTKSTLGNSLLHSLENKKQHNTNMVSLFSMWLPILWEEWPPQYRDDRDGPSRLSLDCHTRHGAPADRKGWSLLAITPMEQWSICINWSATQLYNIACCTHLEQYRGGKWWPQCFLNVSLELP